MSNKCPWCVCSVIQELVTLESGQGDDTNMDLLGGVVVVHPCGASEARQACSAPLIHSLAYIMRNQQDGAGHPPSTAGFLVCRRL